MKWIATALAALATAALMAGCGSSGPDTTPPDTPLDFTRTGGGDGENTFGWTANSEKDLAGYRLYRTTDDPANQYSLVATISADSIKYTEGGLDYTIQYYYKLTAFDEAGNESDRTIAIVAIPANLTAPDPPTGVTASAQNINDQKITLKWEPNTEGDLLEYRIFRATAPDVSTTGTALASVTAGTEQYVDAAVAVGVEYYYKVIAVDKGSLKSPGSQSTEVSDILLAAPSLVSPANGATAASLTPTLRWTSVPGASGYIVTLYDYRSGRLVEKWNKVISSGSTTTVNYGGPALAAGTTYAWGLYTYTNSSDDYNSESPLWDFTTP